MNPIGLALGKGTVSLEVAISQKLQYRKDMENEQNNNESQHWFDDGIVLHDLGQNDESLKAFEKAIRLNPTFARAWNGKGNILYYLDRDDEAFIAYEEAIRIDRKDAFPWIGKGNVLYKQGRYDEAFKACEEAIRLDPKGAFPWNTKGNWHAPQKLYHCVLEGIRYFMP